MLFSALLVHVFFAYLSFPVLDFDCNILYHYYNIYAPISVFVYKVINVLLVLNGRGGIQANNSIYNISAQF